MSSNVIERKPGRPRAIPKELEPEVISVYKQGFGYRATAREPGKKGITIKWGKVRRLIKEKLDENLNYKLKYCPNKTIMPQSGKRKLTVNYCRELERVH